jgi:hypothetical protein
MRALEEAQVERFADELVAHIKGFAPIQFKSMGEEAVRTTISLGLKNARGYGFTLRGPARFFVEIMFMLGSFFDTDPQYRAITRPLWDKNDADETARADRLYDKITAYVDFTSGPQHEYERLALSRAVQTRPDDLGAFAKRPASDLVGVLSAIHPQKVQTLGKSAIVALVEKAYAAAAKRGASWAVGGPLFAGLMFTFGHGCLADPQYPWIAGTLEDTGSSDASVVLERLFQKFRIFLRQAQSRFEGR